jgi:hypothetical protein
MALLIEAGQMTASDYVPTYPDLLLASKGASTDAILVFNRNKDFSSVLSKIKELTESHPNCKRLVRQISETSWVFRFTHRDDANREMTLSVMAFDIPKAT